MKAFPVLKPGHAQGRSMNAMIVALVALLAFALIPDLAFAQAGPVQMQGITNFGCSVVQWLKGPLALLVFVLVCVVVLVFGMITKMDWGRIIGVCIIFGILISLPSLLTSTGLVSNNFGLTACLQ